MCEGFSVTANIYRSKTAAEKGKKVPVVMCAHPYDNNLTPALAEAHITTSKNSNPGAARPTLRHIWLSYCWSPHNRNPELDSRQ